MGFNFGGAMTGASAALGLGSSIAGMFNKDRGGYRPVLNPIRNTPEYNSTYLPAFKNAMGRYNDIYNSTPQAYQSSWQAPNLDSAVNNMAKTYGNQRQALSDNMARYGRHASGRRGFNMYQDMSPLAGFDLETAANMGQMRYNSVMDQAGLDLQEEGLQRQNWTDKMSRQQMLASLASAPLGAAERQMELISPAMMYQPQQTSTAQGALQAGALFTGGMQDYFQNQERIKRLQQQALRDNEYRDQMMSIFSDYASNNTPGASYATDPH